MFGVPRAHGHRLGNFLVDDNVNLDTLFGLALEDTVETIFLMLGGWAPHKQLRGEPPVQDEYGLLCILQHLRERPHVVVAIDVPTTD